MIRYLLCRDLGGYVLDSLIYVRESVIFSLDSLAYVREPVVFSLDSVVKESLALIIKS